MEARDAAIIICRTLALILLIYFVTGLPSLFMTAFGEPLFPQESTRTVLRAELAYGAVLIISAACLWCFAAAIATRMTAGTTTQSVRAWSPDEVWQLVVAGVGLVWLCMSVPRLLVLIGGESVTVAEMGVTMTRHKSSELIADLISTLIGLWLFIGSRGIARFAARARSVGLDKSA